MRAGPRGTTRLTASSTGRGGTRSTSRDGLGKVLRPGARDAEVASSWIGYLRRGGGGSFVLGRDDWPSQVPEAARATVGSGSGRKALEGAVLRCGRGASWSGGAPARTGPGAGAIGSLSAHSESVLCWLHLPLAKGCWTNRPPTESALRPASLQETKIRKPHGAA